MSIVPRLADHPEYHIHYANEQSFLQEHFLDNIDFSCEWLLSTPLLAERTEQLLMIGEASGNRERVTEILLSRAMENDAIFRYTLDQVLAFYESRQNEEMMLWITEHYLDGECASVELQLEWGEKQEILKHLQPGKPAPALILKEQNGETIDLHAIQADRVVLYFWTSWCVHCHTAIESLQRLYQAASGKDVEFVSVSLDENEDEWRSALDENPMPWIHLRDPESWGSDSARRFYVTATPRYFVLGADKTIVAKPKSPEEIAYYLGL
ncbi:TlpA family protein disulfide reductase, partial [candidate division KSB1 bacterium]|nr:TlpA family protein disulfide reductase [candidate division KSB1 bacterium]